MKTLCAALFVVAGAALVTSAHAEESIGVVTAVTGAASLSRGPAPAQPIKFKDRLQWRDVIETRKDASARALLLGKTSITVRELSRVELREESTMEGRLQSVGLLAGKVRAVVERSLMDKGEQVEVRSPNAVAAVRGTDFVVEVIPAPAHAQGFGMLAALSGGPLVAQRPSDVTTVVYTLSGAVDVTSGATERITAFQAARVRGAGLPERFSFTRVDLPNITRGLNVPPPPPARAPQTSDATIARVERAALDQPLRGHVGDVGQPAASRRSVPDVSGKSDKAAVGAPPGASDSARAGDNQGTDPSTRESDLRRAPGPAIDRSTVSREPVESNTVVREIEGRTRRGVEDAVATSILSTVRAPSNAAPSLPVNVKKIDSPASLENALGTVTRVGGDLTAVGAQVSDEAVERLADRLKLPELERRNLRERLGKTPNGKGPTK